MPDLVQYASVFFLTTLAAGFPCWLIGRYANQYSSSRIAFLTTACAIVAAAWGYWRLGILPNWPPRNGLDRLLVVAIPLAILVESLLWVAFIPRRAISGLRIVVAVVIVGTLLFGSVYLRDGADSWLSPPRLLALFGCAAALAASWDSLPSLATRRGDPTLLAALSASILSAGLTILLGGYIKGGAAAIPWSAMLAGCVLALLARPLTATASQAPNMSQTVAGIALVALFGLLFIGRFFGGIGNYEAMTIFATPSLLWLLELQVIKRLPRAVQRSLAFALIVAPLAIVVFQAKAAFDRKLGRIVSSTSRELHQNFTVTPLTQRHSNFLTLDSSERSPSVVWHASSSSTFKSPCQVSFGINEGLGRYHRNADGPQLGNDSGVDRHPPLRTPESQYVGNQLLSSRFVSTRVKRPARG
jgi:hypothetical protein